MTAHSRIAPSSAHRWVYCPASVQMQERHPTDESESAREGTEAHAIAEQALQGRGYPVDAPEEMKNGVHKYVSDVRNVVGDNAVMIEHRVQAPYIHAESYGTPDAHYVHFDKLYVWDFKYGRRKVSAVENWQLINYTSGLIELYPEVQRVEFRIVQPRVYGSAPVNVWKSTVEALRPYFDKLRTSAGAALSQYARATPGGHCRDCSARHACEPLQVAISGILDLQLLPVNRELDNKQLGRELSELKAHAKLLEYRITALEERAVSFINDGLPVLGFTAERSYGRLAWDVPIGEVVQLGKLYGVDLGKTGSMTPAQAVKAGIPQDIIDNFASRPDNGIKLVEIDKQAAKAVFGGK